MGEEQRKSILGRRLSAQWFVFLGGPFAWGGQLILGYFTVAVLCDVLSPGIVQALLYLISLGAIGISGLAAVFALVAIRSGRTMSEALFDETEDRPAFMGVAGALTSLVFLLVILMGTVAVILMQPCS